MPPTQAKIPIPIASLAACADCLCDSPHDRSEICSVRVFANNCANNTSSGHQPFVLARLPVHRRVDIVEPLNSTPGEPDNI